MEEGQCAACNRLSSLLAAQKAKKSAEAAKEAAKAAAKQAREERLKPQFARDEDYFIGLGLLAATCFVDAHVPPQFRAKFAGDYLGLTGLPANAGDTGFTTADPNQWGISMRIYFPKRVLSILPGLEAFVTCTDISDSNTSAVNNKRWAYELFSLGFRLGRKHDLEAIRRSIPPESLEAFDLGFSSAAPAESVQMSAAPASASAAA
jgi:hypothetical protein